MMQGMWIGRDGSGITLWYAAFVLLIGFTVILWHRKQSASYLICFVVFGIYVLAMLDVLFFPIRIVPGRVLWEGGWRWSLNLIPFRFNFDDLPHLMIRQIFQNILLTVPFGFGLSFVLRERVKHIGWLALIVGISGEAIQLAISLMLGYLYRTIDVNDVMLNMLGVLIGYGLFRVFAWLTVRIVPLIGIRHWGVMGYVCLRGCQPQSSSTLVTQIHRAAGEAMGFEQF